MIPSRLIALKQLPIKSNNKIDLKTLPAAEGKPRDSIVSPQDEIEAVLCLVAVENLGVEAGITNNFFDLDGRSLVATRPETSVSRRVGFRVSVKDVFGQSVLVDLTAKIRIVSLQNLGGDMIALKEAESAPTQMLQTIYPQSYTTHEIIPLLPKEHHNRIVDIYPATQVQKTFLLEQDTGSRMPVALLREIVSAQLEMVGSPRTAGHRYRYRYDAQ